MPASVVTFLPSTDLTGVMQERNGRVVDFDRPRLPVDLESELLRHEAFSSRDAFEFGQSTSQRAPSGWRRGGRRSIPRTGSLVNMYTVAMRITGTTTRTRGTMRRECIAVVLSDRGLKDPHSEPGRCGLR